MVQRGVDLVDGAEADTSHLDEDEQVLKVSKHTREKERPIHIIYISDGRPDAGVYCPYLHVCVHGACVSG